MNTNSLANEANNLSLKIKIINLYKFLYKIVLKKETKYFLILNNYHNLFKLKSILKR